MIDEAASHDRVLTYPAISVPLVVQLGSYEAFEDLTLRRARFYVYDLGQNGPHQAILSTDPGLNPQPAVNNLFSDWQLVGFSNVTWGVNNLSEPTILPSVTEIDFDNLSFPLRKGQNLYWGTSGGQLNLQLFFS